MWTVLEACEVLNTTEPSLFIRANRVYGGQNRKPLEDLKTYQEVGAMPPYLVAFLEYQRSIRAIG